MIPNGEGWLYIAVKKLSALLRGITSKHDGDFYCLNCLHSFRKKLESHKNVCKNKNFCSAEMSCEDTKILEFNQYQKFGKAPFIIYANLEYLIEKIDGLKYNPENASTTKVRQQIPSGFSMSTIPSCKNIEKQHDVYRGKDCMKKFCESFKEQAMEIINFKKRKMNLLTKEQHKSFENAQLCYI